MKHHTLSRVAERVYWMGRYQERAANLARMVRVHADFLIDMPKRLPLGWRPLVDVTGTRTAFEALYPDYEERSVVRYVTGETRNPGSIVNSLAAARENARTVREILPRASFELINDNFLAAKNNLGGNLSRVRLRQTLVEITQRAEQIEGFLSGNMLHNEAWQFLRVGNFLERADMTTRVIDAQTLGDVEGLEVFDDLGWRSALRSLYAFEAYQATMQEPVTEAPVLEFLFTNPMLPRSVSRCFDSLCRSLRHLPRHEKPLRIANRLRRGMASAPVRELTGNSLHEFVDQQQVGLSELHDQIAKTYFYFQPRRR